MIPKDIKLNKAYIRYGGYIQFPKCIILLRKYNDLEGGRYTYFDIELGKELYYLTDNDIKLAYEEVDDQYV